MHLGTKDHNSATNQACLVLIGISQHFLASIGSFGIWSENFKEPSGFTDYRWNPFGIVPTPISSNT